MTNILTTDWFRTNYYTVNWATPKQVKINVFSRTPEFNESSQQVFSTLTSADDLSNYPEWVLSNSTLVDEVSGTLENFYLKKISIDDSFDALQLVFDNSGSYVSASLETGAGWTFNPTSPATSVQESVEAVAFYLKGTYGSVTDPLLFATTQGIGSGTVVHDGAMFGQSNTSAPSGKENVVTIPVITTTNRTIASVARTSNVSTLTTSAAHGFSIGDVVVVSVPSNTSFDGYFVVSAVPTNTSFSYYNAGTDVSTTTTSGTVAFKLKGMLSSYTLLLPALPKWEGSHANHMWLEPQRTNLIVNPSFENSNQGYGWRANNSTGGSLTIASVTGGVDPNRPKCGRISGTGTHKILESNLFPAVGEWYSVSFSIAAQKSGSNACSITYGLVAHDSSYTQKAFSKSSPVLASNGSATEGFVRINGLIRAPQNVSEFCFRVEVTGCTQFWIDNVLVDPHEGQYQYFDGSSNDGLPGDFRWMGGTDYTDSHFSVWYNNYRNTRFRLMGDYDTQDDLYKPGLVEEWAPTGANVVAHWDSVTSFTPSNWYGDAFYPVSDVNGTPVSTITSFVNFDLTTPS
jgi:hypothetical protein